MATQAPEGRGAPMPRDRARLFDEQAERYDRVRPGYPAALLDAVLGPSPHGVDVLDVACGTGIAARQLAHRGARVLGVELNPGMARIAEGHGIPTEVTDFESWDPAGRTFDVVTCAQAWHWLDPEVSLAKALAVLRTGGRLCLFWNIGHHPDELADALRAAYQRVLPPDLGRYVIGYAADRAKEPAGDLSPVAGALAVAADLAPPRTERFPWRRVYTRDEWLDELQTHSDHAALPADLRSRLFAEIGSTVDRYGGAFEMPYVAILIMATRT